VICDNAKCHTSHKVAVYLWEHRGRVDLHFPPSYSPELNQAEPVFRQVKHQEIPQRSFTTRAGLREAVVTGFDNFGRKLRPKYPKELRPAA